MKVLLLNPPGIYIYDRECYCNKISKTGLSAYPLDLLAISGILKKNNINFDFLDANAERKSEYFVLKKIFRENYSRLILLISSVSISEDLRLISILKNKYNYKGKILVSGDIVFAGDSLKKPLQDFIDCFIKDFTSPSIVEYLKEPESFSGAIERYNEPFFNYYIPAYEKINPDNYQFPLGEDKYYFSVLSNFGCPYTCSFCLFSNIKFKERDNLDFEEEIKFISLNYDIREIYLADQNFASDNSDYKTKCEILKKYKMKWICFSRIDSLNKSKIRFLKESGCRALMFGVESVSATTREKYKKQFDNDIVCENINYLKENKIKSLATYIIGLPGDSVDNVLKTIEYACKIDTDYASFNVASPKFSTVFENDIINITQPFSQYGNDYVLKSNFKKDEIKQLLKTAIRKYYFRAGYVKKFFKTLNSFYKIRKFTIILFNLIKKIFY
ncbi:MAG TPA: radical SAM protein [bacterium]|nr:radical SAM protein [bacterium]